jgi:membrane protease YdiL (CAAX protease family)
MRLVKQLVVVAIVAFGGSLVVNAVPGNAPLVLVFGLATAVLSVLAYRWVVRRTEHRAPEELAGKGAPAAIGRGALIGVGLFGAVIANIAFLGGYQVLGWGSVAGTAAAFGFSAAAAVTEELLFRGVLFRIIEERIGTWSALALTAVLFGASHLFNAHATLWSAIAIALEAGGMLAAAYAATRNLWVPIGLHFAWNFAEGGIFGTDVSGQSGAGGLLHGALSGPAPLTGGEFGPEASLYALAGGVVTTIVFLWLARRRGHLVPRRRRPTAPAATLVP